MEDVMMEQRSLIDALTAECLALREESASLKVSSQSACILFIIMLLFFVCVCVRALTELISLSELERSGVLIQVSLQERISELEQRLDMVILAMGELGKDGDAQNKEGNAQSMSYHTLCVCQDSMVQ